MALLSHGGLGATKQSKEEPIQEGGADAPPSDFPYTGQGPFVIGPARFISAPISGMGFMLGAIVCAPVSLAQDPHLKGGVPEEKQAHLVCGRAVAKALRWPVYAAVGLPFYLGKLLFWDAPRAAAPKVGPPLTKASHAIAKPVLEWWNDNGEADHPPPTPSDLDWDSYRSKPPASPPPKSP